MKQYEKLLSGLYKILKVLLTVTFMVMTAALTIQIFARYLFKKGWPWTDEVARYGCFLCVYIGASLALFTNDHIHVNFLEGITPKGTHRWLRFARMLIVTVYSAFMVAYGPKVIALGRTSVSPNMGIPMHLVYMIFPVSFALVFLYALFNTLCYLLGYPQPSDKEDAHSEGKEAEQK